MSPKTIQEVLQSHTSSLMGLPGVVGTALGESGGKPCILILVARKTSKVMNQVPATLDGYPVTVMETGEIKASPAEQEKPGA